MVSHSLSPSLPLSLNLSFISPQDYMNQAQGKGKTVHLQHITVKVPGQHMPISKTNSLPHSTTSSVDHITNQSDRSESISPMTAHMLESHPFNGEPALVTPSSPSLRPRDGRSPTSECDSTDTLDDLTRSDRYPFSHVGGAGAGGSRHLRNNSMDEITLQLLKTSGAAYPPPISSSPGLSPEDHQPRDRSYTLNRMTKKEKGKWNKGTMLSPISYSEEELSEPSRSGSHENLKMEKKGKKDNKNRNSFVLVERTGSDSVPAGREGESNKKDKKVVSKHKRNASQGFVKTIDAMETSSTGGKFYNLMA